MSGTTKTWIAVLAVLVVVLALACLLKPLLVRLFQALRGGIVRAKILQVLRGTPEGDRVALADVTPFEWDSVCLFGTGASHEYINQVIGFEWLNGKGYVQDQTQHLVFVRDQEVIQRIVFRPEIVWGNFRSSRMGVCLSPAEAVFTIDGYDSLDGRIHMFELPNAIDDSSFGS